jgi:hypothetical protein
MAIVAEGLFVFIVSCDEVPTYPTYACLITVWANKFLLDHVTTNKLKLIYCIANTTGMHCINIKTIA